MMTRKFNTLLALLASTLQAFGQPLPATNSPSTNVSSSQPSRSVMVHIQSSLLLSPTNFWSANASAARQGLGLSSAATNPSTAFQPASSALTNLVNSNGGALTNLQAANLVGLIPASNISTVNLTNIGGTLAVNSGGTGATNATGARQNLGISATGDAVATAANPTAARIAIGALATNGDASGLTNFSPVLLRTNGSGAGLTGLNAASVVGTVASASNVAGVVPVTNGGSGSSTASGARANFGLGLSALTNTNADSFRTAIGLAWSGLTNGDAASFRAALGLGTAATNPATSFQQASSALTNVAAGNGSALTNLQATNIVGVIPASNISTLTLTNVGGTLGISSGGTGATNAAGARTALGLGSAATNASSAFQSSSATLTSLAAGNGGALTNLTASSLVGILPASVVPSVAASNVSGLLQLAQGGTGANSAAGARSALGLGTAALSASTAFQPSSTVLSNLSLGNGNGLTNISVAGVTGALATNGNGAGLSNLTAANITGILAISNGGSGATTAGGARTNLGLGAANDVAFQNITISDQNLTLSHGPEDDVFVRNDSGNLEFGTEGNGVYFKVQNSTLSTRFEVPIEFNNANNAAATRTNLALGATWLTNTNVTNFRTAIGLGADAQPVFNGALITGDLFAGSLEVTSGSNSTAVTADGIEFTGRHAANSRTNLGLGWPALTNSNAGTSLVSVNSNGQVVSPTNFWQLASIQTNITSITVGAGSATNMAVQIGTNATTGMFATSGPNLLRFRNGAASMDFATNGALSVGSITFSGGANIAATRTNLELGLPALTNTTVTGLRNALGLGSSNDVTFNTITLGSSVNAAIIFGGDSAERTRQNLNALAANGNGAGLTNLTATNITGAIAISNGGSGATTADGARTNLGLGATWLTNITASNFRTAIELGATNDVQFGRVLVNGVVDAFTNAFKILRPVVIADRGSTNNVFQFEIAADSAIARTNLGLGWSALTNTNAATFQGALFAATNAAPTNTTNRVGWVDVRVGTNTYKLEVFQ